MQAQSFPLAVRVTVPTTHWDGTLAADLFAPCGTPWLAVFDGVADARDYPLGGHTVLLTADDGTQAYYAHGRPDRTTGRVHAGQVIGYVSNTGNANHSGSGHEEAAECHLHFSVGQIDANGSGSLRPIDWLSGAGGPPAASEPSPTLADVAAGVPKGLLLVAAAAAAYFLLSDDNPSLAIRRRIQRFVNPDFFEKGGVIHPIRKSPDYDPSVEGVQREQKHERTRAAFYRGIKRERYGRLEGGVDRPSWATGLSDAQLERIARAHGQRATTEGWYEAAHLTKGSGELKRLLGESGVRQVKARARTTEHRASSAPARLKSAQRRAARGDFRDLPW